jgi:hypothetical protein
MLKRLAPLALLCVCLFTVPAAADARKSVWQNFKTDYASAYACADIAYSWGWDVNIDFDQTSGWMRVYVYPDGLQFWYPEVCFTWLDFNLNFQMEMDMPPDKPSVFP